MVQTQIRVLVSRFWLCAHWRCNSFGKLEQRCLTVSTFPVWNEFHSGIASEWHSGSGQFQILSHYFTFRKYPVLDSDSLRYVPEVAVPDSESLLYVPEVSSSRFWLIMLHSGSIQFWILTHYVMFRKYPVLDSESLRYVPEVAVPDSDSLR
jgi:hypothetical protein